MTSGQSVTNHKTILDDNPRYEDLQRHIGVNRTNTVIRSVELIKYFDGNGTCNDNPRGPPVSNNVSVSAAKALLFLKKGCPGGQAVDSMGTVNR